MLDFSQGGYGAKMADNLIPYLNAAVQGTRGTFRAFKTNPAEASFKAAQLAAIGAGMANVMSTMFAELYDSLSDREKATKWIIPLPWKKRDSNGEERHAYIAIPKDQFQQVFAAVGQSAVDIANGRPWSGQMVDAATSLIPVEMANISPPVVNAALAYFGNYDSWKKEQVWRGGEVSASKEYTAYTPEIARDISAALSKAKIEVSPDRLATATSKVIPTSNPVGMVLARFYELPQEAQQKMTEVEAVRAVPGLRRFLRYTSPVAVRERTAQTAERLGIDITGKVENVVRREIADAERARGDIRQPHNVSMDEFIAVSRPSEAALRTWLDKNIDDEDEKKRLWNRARLKRPDMFAGTYSTSRRRKTRTRKKRTTRTR